MTTSSPSHMSAFTRAHASDQSVLAMDSTHASRYVTARKLAQRVEQRTVNPSVTGSTPVFRLHVFTGYVFGCTGGGRVCQLSADARTVISITSTYRISNEQVALQSVDTACTAALALGISGDAHLTSPRMPSAARPSRLKHDSATVTG